MPRNLAPVGDDFLTTAGLILRASADLPHSAEQIWAALTSDEMGSWTGPFATATWRSARPLATGARRSIRVLRLIKIEEEYYRWEEPHRATFRVTSINAPIVSGWAEDVLLERREGGGTRLTLTMALDNKLFRVMRIPRWLQPRVTAACERMIIGMAKILPAPDGR